MEKKRTGMKITISLMSLIIVILIILLLLCRCGAGTDEVCSGCGRDITLPRVTLEKSIKRVEYSENTKTED